MLPLLEKRRSIPALLSQKPVLRAEIKEQPFYVENRYGSDVDATDVKVDTGR